MCGIAGAIDLGGRPLDPRFLKALADGMRHRGPDDEGYVLIDQATGHPQRYAGADSPADVRARVADFGPGGGVHAANIGLAHRRRSVCTGSSMEGHQPFFSADRSCCVVLDGSISNYPALRAELERDGSTFRTRADIELLAEAYRVWGSRCVRRFNGSWVLALYDFRRRRVILSRGRPGKARLYYSRVDNQLWFASDSAALLRVPDIAHRCALERDVMWHWTACGVRQRRDGGQGIEGLPSAVWAVVDDKFGDRIEKCRQERQTYRLKSASAGATPARRRQRVEWERRI